MRILWLLFTVLGFFACSPAWAQTPGAHHNLSQFLSTPLTTLYDDIPQPLQETIRNIPADSDPFYAGLTVEQSYNDNIYLTETGEQTDFITSARPEAALTRSWGRHSFTLNGKADIRRYWDHSDENTEDLDVALGGNLEGYRILNFPFEISYARDHRERSNRAFTPPTKKPVTYKTIKAEASVLYTPNRVVLGLTGRHVQTRFDDGEHLVNSRKIIEKDNDTNRLEIETILSYDTRRTLKPFASFSFENSEFQRRQYTGTGFNGLNRDSTLLRMLAGTFFNFRGLITGHIALGHEKRRYDDAAIGSRTGMAADALINWTPTERLTFTAELQNANRDDTLIQSGGELFETALSARYDLGRDTFAHAKTTYRNRDFTLSGREDSLYGLDFVLDHALSEKFSIGTGYSYRNEESNTPGFDYDQNIVFVRASGKL